MPIVHGSNGRFVGSGGSPKGTVKRNALAAELRGVRSQQRTTNTRNAKFFTGRTLSQRRGDRRVDNRNALNEAGVRVAIRRGTQARVVKATAAGRTLTPKRLETVRFHEGIKAQLKGAVAPKGKGFRGSGWHGSPNTVAVLGAARAGFGGDGHARRAARIGARLGNRIDRRRR